MGIDQSNYYSNRIFSGRIYFVQGETQHLFPESFGKCEVFLNKKKYFQNLTKNKK